MDELNLTKKSIVIKCIHNYKYDYQARIDQDEKSIGVLFWRLSYFGNLKYNILKYKYPQAPL